METQPAGIYIHVPFCVKRCRYCDFYSQTDLSLCSDFVAALLREIELAPDPGPVDSLYFGGGTPSLLEPARIERIILSIRTRFTLSPDTEITIEANPGTVDEKRLPAFRAAGVNRLNLGVQSFDDGNLAFLGRIHTAAAATRAAEAARAAGFGNLGLDLIYGLPGQTAANLRCDLEKATAFNPEHLACYLLTYEKGTALDKQREQGHVVPLAEQATAALYLENRRVLSESGYAQYEISNFSRSDHYRSRHNRKYWTFAPYIGLGPAAHSYLEPVRAWNHRDLARYLADLETGRLPVAEKETLTANQQMIEAVYLGLRQTRGIPIREFNQRFSLDLETVFEPVLSDPFLAELLELETDFVRLTPEGMLVMDTVVGRFVDLIPL